MRKSKVTAVETEVISAITQKLYHGFTGIEYGPSGRTMVDGSIHVEKLEIEPGTSQIYSRASGKFELVKEAWIATAGYITPGKEQVCRILAVANTAAGMASCWLYLRKDRTLFSKMSRKMPDGTEVAISLVRGALEEISLTAINNLTDKALLGSPWMASYLDPMGTTIAVPEVALNI